MNKSIKNIVLTSLFIAIAIILPPIFHSMGDIVGKALSPMHFPILLCGFLLGWQYGIFAGFITPIIASIVWGMPKLIPTGISMSFELGVYGLMSGLLYNNIRILKNKICHLYLALIISMFLGRLIYGLINTLILGSNLNEIGFSAFFVAFSIIGIPGIIIQILIIPPIVIKIENRNKYYNEKYR